MNTDKWYAAVLAAAVDSQDSDGDDGNNGECEDGDRNGGNEDDICILADLMSPKSQTLCLKQ